MIRIFVFLFIFLTLGPKAFLHAKDATSDYAFAQQCYRQMDKTKVAGWDRCLHLFQVVVDKFPASSEAPKAFFSVARLTHEKYFLTQSSSELSSALKLYNEFLKAYPKNSMADDALYRIGLLRYEAQGDKAKALKAFRTLIDRYPYSDMAVEAAQYLQKIQKDKTERPQPVITAQADAEESPTIKVEEKNSKGQAPIKVVVIDPGHGGEDSGAVGARGTKESVVALQIARKLAFKLKKEFGLQVHLTRTNNRTVSLNERNILANSLKADLFISIHANASSSKKQGGVQTFYLSNATHESARQLALRENRHRHQPSDTSEKILDRMLQSANIDESRDLARLTHKSLVKSLRKEYSDVVDLDVDSAIFQALAETNCPSILVETSFITHPREELKLRDSDYQWVVADGLADGIQKYIVSHNNGSLSSL